MVERLDSHINAHQGKGRSDCKDGDHNTAATGPGHHTPCVAKHPYYERRANTLHASHLLHGTGQVDQQAAQPDKDSSQLQKQ